MNILKILVITLGITLIFNIFAAILIIFFERKNPTTTWAWLMVLVLIPDLGFLLYLLLGQNLSKKKLFKLKHNSKMVKDLFKQKELLTQNHLEFEHREIYKYKDMIFMHINNSDAVFTQDNDVKIFTDGNKKFDALINDIENATNHIHILYYIVKGDVLGKRVVSALTKKAKEGIEVRLLYDGMGGRKIPKNFFDEFEKAGGKRAIFFPSMMKINYRNHRKIAVIDGQIGYIGGLNIGDEYLGLNKKFGYWRDTHLRLTGSSLDSLQERFLMDWNLASNEKIEYSTKHFPKKKFKSDKGIQIVSSGPDSKWQQIKNGYLKIINSARKHIYIQTPYLVPDESILEALRLAALSGVDVNIMIPDKPDHPFVYWASYSYIADLLEAGAKVYTYNNGFLHAKTIVADSMVSSVGTANLDVRSFKLNFEVNAFVYDREVALKLEKAFKEDIKVSTLITQAVYDSRSKFIKFKESISRLLSPIL